MSSNCTCNFTLAGSDGSTSDGSTPVLGFDILQVSDFYVQASILHPFAVGSIGIIALFAFVRISSNRSIAPLTVFDWIINVALGSTLAGIVNGNSLVRGILGLITLLGFQFVTSMLSSRAGGIAGRIVASPPVIIAFRGRALNSVMRKHRVSRTELNAALRTAGMHSLDNVECCVIEATGAFSVYKRSEMPTGRDAQIDVLLDIPGYELLVQDAEEQPGKDGGSDGGPDGCGTKQQGDIANACA